MDRASLASNVALHAIGVLVWITTLGGCAQERSPDGWRDGGTVESSALAGRAPERDSAGIHIVENDPEKVPEWAIDTVPIVRIGVIEGDTHQTLHNVGGAQRLPDGRIVVANAHTELRFFSAEGRYLSTTGASGSGPGEFEEIAGMIIAGDTILVYDADARRLSFIHVDGRYLGSAAMPGVHEWIGGRARLAAVAPEGLVFLGNGWRIPRRDSLGLYQLRVANLVVTRDGSRVDSLGATRMDWMTGDRQVLVPPFTRISHAAADGGYVVVTNPDLYEIEVWSIASRRLERLIRVVGQPPALTRAEFDSAARGLVDRELRAQLGGADRPEIRAALERLASRMEPYATKPSYSGVLVDAEGNVWVRHWTPAGATRHPYDVFDAEGHMVGRLNSPASVSFLQVGRDFVLVKERDSLNVEYVSLHTLHKRP